MPMVKNMRHGRIRIRSGDTTPLELVTDFTDGNFKTDEAFPTNVVRSRGAVREVTRGDEQVVGWSFSASFRDKTTLRTLRDKVWAATTEAKTGLTAAALNTGVAAAYPFEQGSFEITSAGVWVKLAVGVVPAADREYVEVAGAEDIEGVIRATTYSVKMPAATTALALLYDAVGRGTLGAATDICQGGVKAFDLWFDVFDPCNPPDPDDSTAGTILETAKLNDSFIESLSFEEGDAADKVTFGGHSLIPKVVWVTV